ncbi:hypothetical protein EVAR_81631_1 [Eumeta japonica]|uniref:Uncharacterized protein n=1 Tax=Eumeta variegata TaxID=151549 RepID=A0A4C1WDV9_EUMVA|nr:hypothetical protein EVAR_81631_1 [Eumeta japonica]
MYTEQEQFKIPQHIICYMPEARRHAFVKVLNAKKKLEHTNETESGRAELRPRTKSNNSVLLELKVGLFYFLLVSPVLLFWFRIRFFHVFFSISYYTRDAYAPFQRPALDNRLRKWNEITQPA